MSVITQEENISGKLDDAKSLNGTIHEPKKIFGQGTNTHNDLSGRDVEKCHPMSAIDGLLEKIEVLNASIETLSEELVPEAISNDDLEKILI